MSFVDHYKFASAVGGEHRYWRARFADGGTNSFVALRELAMYETAGGSRVDQALGGSASSSLSGQGPELAFDSDFDTTFWSTDTGLETNSWLANDLGASNDADLDQAMFGGSTDYWPTAIVMEYSDDNSNWTTDTRWPTLSSLPWRSEEIKIITRSISEVRRRFKTTSSTNSGAWSGYTARTLFPAANIGAGSKVAISIASSTIEGLGVSAVYVGTKGTGTYDFASAPTQVTFSGGSTGFTIGANTTIKSDDISLAVGASDGVVIAVYISGPGSSDGFQRFTGSGMSSAYIVGNDTTTLVASGYTAAAEPLIAGLEIVV
jgi:hypothetical protein